MIEANYFFVGMIFLIVCALVARMIQDIKVAAKENPRLVVMALVAVTLATFSFRFFGWLIIKLTGGLG